MRISSEACDRGHREGCARAPEISAEPASTAILRTTEAQRVFTSTHGAVCAPRNGGTLEVLARSEPTGKYGIGVSRLRSDTPVYVTSPPTDHHALWLLQSQTNRLVTRLAGRRIDHEQAAGSFNTSPAAADVTVETARPAEGVLLRVSAECLTLAGSQLAAHGGTLIERTGARDEKLFGTGEILEAEAAAGHPNGMLFWSSATDALIRHLAAHHLSLPAAPPRGAMSRQALKTLDAYIHANLAGPLDLHSLAAVVGCDRFHFAHRFRAAVGMSPHRYVMRLRLERARERIRKGAGSLAEIAVATGFADQSHLCRWVRRVYNLRPSDILSSQRRHAGRR